MTDSAFVLNGKVFDGTDRAPLPDGSVAVKDDRIVWVGESSELPRKYRESPYEHRDYKQCSILPGLIDGHTHISFGEARSEEELALYTPPEYRTIKALWNAKKVLQAGVTSAFDAATTFDVAQAVRDAIDAGMYEGPRFSVSGKQLTTHQGLEDSFPNNMQFPPGQAGTLVKSRDEIVEEIRRQIKDRVDAVKVSGSNDSLITPDSLDGAAFSQDEFDLIAQEVHRLGKICTVHARTRDSVICAAKAKFDVIFHASYIDDEGIDYCLKNNVLITPTLTLLMNIVDAAGKAAGASSVVAFEKEIEAASRNLARAYEAGVAIGAGSESGWSPVPYGEWHGREAEILVQNIGMSNVDAIRAITSVPTRCLKRYGHEVGKLEAGRYADVLVLDGDPSVDIQVLQQRGGFKALYKGGKRIDLTPPGDRRVWFYEKHRMFLDGVFKYDETKGEGYIAN